MADLQVREVTIGDLDAMMAVIEASDIADTGEIDIERSDVTAAFADPRTRGWALVDAAGSYAALVYIEQVPGRPSQSGELFVDPTCDPAIATPLIDALLAAAVADPENRKLHVMVNSNAPAKSALLQAFGATIVRHFFKMAIGLELTTAAAVDAWPPGAELLTVADVDADLAAVHLSVSEAFEDHWDHASQDFDGWQARHRARDDFDPSLWWLVRVDGEPAAATMCTSRGAGGFIATLGVRRPYRGQGLARRLLETAFAEFRRRSFDHAHLFVDSESPTGAVRLYEAAGMHVAAQWDCHEFPPAN